MRMTPPFFHRLALSALACAALTACGGGGDDNPTPAIAYLEGPVGQVVALAPEILSSGTYPVSDCTDQNNQSVNRKLRLNSDGSVQWLNATNDAVLAQFTPSTSARQYREIHVMAGGAFSYYVEEQSGVAPAPSAATVSFEITPNNIDVTGPNGLTEQCGAPMRVLAAPARANAAATPVVSIPLVISDVIVARRLASAVQSTGVGINGQLSRTESVSTGMPPAVTVYDVLRSVSGSGAISSQVNTSTTTNPPVAWGNWIDALLAAATGSSGGYYEEWDATAAGGLANAVIRAQAEHPSLTDPALAPLGGSVNVIELLRDPAVQTDGKAVLSPSSN